MSKIKYLYSLEYIPEIRAKDEEAVNVKILGIFTSRRKVREAIERYKKLPGFIDKGTTFDDEYGEGFYISYVPLSISYWNGGYTTMQDFTENYGISTVYDEDNTDSLEQTIHLPYWFKGEKLRAVANSSEFVESIMQEKYHTPAYPKDHHSEVYQIKKFIEMYHYNLL